MTEVKIYGFLSKKFGNTIKIHLGKLNDLLMAIDSIKNGFRDTIIELSKKGINYCIQRIKNIIHIIPIISGSGKLARIIIGAVLIILAIVAAVFQQYWLASSLLSSAIQLFTFKDPKVPSLRIPDQFTGGGALTTDNASKSYTFSNNANLAIQGSIVPLGYGEFKVGSILINLGVKNYSTDSSFFSEISSEPLAIEI